jgi:hypothetical protein
LIPRASTGSTPNDELSAVTTSVRLNRSGPLPGNSTPPHQRGTREEEPLEVGEAEDGLHADRDGHHGDEAGPPRGRQRSKSHRHHRGTEDEIALGRTRIVLFQGAAAS